MTLANSSTEYIYQGVWTNWSKGRVLGSTLTVSPANAAILSPAIAILIQIAGTQLWRLFQFVLHQSRATSAKRDFLYHQQQVALRNSSTDLNTIWRLFRLGLAWRHQKDIKVLGATFFLVFWSVIHFLAVIAFSLMSTSLLSAGNQVLSRSPWCGYFSAAYGRELQGSSYDDILKQMEYSNFFNSKYASVQQHVDLCSGILGEGCNTLPTNALSFQSTTQTGSCPFGSSACNPNIDGSISIQTDYISSHTDLGFNAEKGDRVSFRLSAQCAPLNDKKYISDWKDIAATDSVPAHQVVDAYYGTSKYAERNATYSFSNYRNLMECDQRSRTSPYTLDSEFYGAGGGGKSFAAIPDLRVTNADTSIVFLTFNNAYMEPVTDPWFSAQQVLNDTRAFCALQKNQTVYVRERPLTTLGCTQQWEICNTDSSSMDTTKSCTPPLGRTQLASLFQNMKNTNVSFTPRQNATVDRILKSATGASFYYVVYSLSQSTAPPLQARHMITDTVGPSLPADQWKNETEYWTSILLAMIQQTSLDFSTGQFTASTDYIQAARPALSNASVPAKEAQDAAYWLCQNQIIRSDTYRSFNFFSLCLTIAVCLIIMILGLSIEDLIGYIRQRSLRYTGSNGKQDMWIINSDLEMLRNLSKIQTGAVWGRTKSGIPLAQPGYKASITELQSDDLEAEQGTGIVNRRVRKTRTGLSELHKLRSQTYGSSFSFGPNNKNAEHSQRSGTASTLDLSPDASTTHLTSALKSSSAEHNNKASESSSIEQPFVFQNSYQNTYDRGKPLSSNGPTGVVSSTTATTKGGDKVMTVREQEFSYENSLPSSDEATTVLHHSTPSPPSESMDDSNSHAIQPTSPMIPKSQFQTLYAFEQDESYHGNGHRDVVQPPSGWGVLPKNVTSFFHRGHHGDDYIQ